MAVQPIREARSAILEATGRAPIAAASRGSLLSRAQVRPDQQRDADYR
jgi:hypothetical protein